MADGRVQIQIKADDRELKQAEGSMKKFTGAVLAARVVETAFRAIANSVDGAISRIDTLNQYPRVLESMGASADDAERSIDRLSEGTMGLPVKLDDVASTAQRMFTSFRDSDLATESTLALNNALLASSATTQDAARGTEQYVKMMSSGKVEMDTWNTLSETMSYALSEVAGKLGYSTENTWELYDALKDGEVSLRDFNAMMIEASNETGGFAEQAKTATGGIETAWIRVQSAVTIGTLRIIEAFDAWLESAGFGGIEGALDSMREAINSMFGAVETGMRVATPLVNKLFDMFIFGIGVVDSLDFAIAGLLTSFLAFKAIQQVKGWLDGVNVVMQALTWSTGTYNDIMNILTNSLGGATVAQKVFGTIAAVATGQINLATVATTLLTKAKYALLGPVTLVAAAIGVLVAAGVGLYKWLMRTSPEVEALSEEMTEASQATDDLTSAADNNARAYESQQEQITNQSNAIQALVEETYELTQAEDLNAAQKKVIQENVETLNDSVDGLNVAYDEENNLLSQSVDQIMARVEAMEAEELMIAAQERQMEITQERADLEAQLEANTRLLSEAQAEEQELTWSQVGARKELNERTGELEEKNAELMIALEELGVVGEVVAEQEMANAAKVAEAEEESKNRRINALSELQEHERVVYDAMQSRTEELTQAHINSFNKIEENTDLTMASVRESLEHNIKTMADWAENMDTLANKGVDQGMLEELRRLGPEGGPLVQELVNASDEELAEMEGLFQETGNQSKEIMFDELGIGPDDTIDGIPELVDGTATAWYEGINTSNISKALPEEIEKGRPDMVEAGKFVAEGAGEGIEQGTPEAVAASLNLSKAIDKEFIDNLGIQSPSRVFMSHGADLVAGLKQGINQNEQGAVATIQKLGQAMNKAMADEIRTMNTDTSKAFGDYTRDLNRLAQDNQRSMQHIQRTIQTTTRNITRQMDITTRNVTNSWNRMTQQMAQQTRTGFNNIYSIISTALTRTEQRALVASRQVANHLRGGVAGATDAGRQMGLGFHRGLASTQNSIMSLARGIANSASNSIRSALRIQSPSKVTHELGKFVGEGFIDGMDSMVRGVEKTGNRLAESAIPRINPMSSFGGLGYSTGGHTQHDNRQFAFNVHPSGTESNEREFYERLFREFKYYIQQEGGAFK